MKNDHPKGMHHITKCEICDIIISECACVDPYKVVLYEICDKCRQDKTKNKIMLDIIKKALKDYEVGIYKDNLFITHYKESGNV